VVFGGIHNKGEKRLLAPEKRLVYSESHKKKKKSTNKPGALGEGEE